jgi:hypothetical protein
MTRLGGFDAASRELKAPLKRVPEFSTESLKRQPLFAVPPMNACTSVITSACRVAPAVVPVATLVDAVVAGWFVQVIPPSVHEPVTRRMFQVRVTDGADERTTLSVAACNDAPAGIEQDAMSNLTKLRLSLEVTSTRTPVSYDWTSSVEAEPLFVLVLSSSTKLSADEVNVHVLAGTALAAVQLVRRCDVMPSVAAIAVPVATRAAAAAATRLRENIRPIA